MTSLNRCSAGDLLWPSLGDSWPLTFCLHVRVMDGGSLAERCFWVVVALYTGAVEGLRKVMRWMTALVPLSFSDMKCDWQETVCTYDASLVSSGSVSRKITTLDPERLREPPISGAQRI